MTSVTQTVHSNHMAAFRAVIWLETVALSLMLWVAILQVLAKI